MTVIDFPGPPEGEPRQEPLGNHTVEGALAGLEGTARRLMDAAIREENRRACALAQAICLLINEW